MSYLIDGNNVMGQRVGWHRDKAGARRRLLEELARFARGAGLRVEVVFDGTPDEFFPDGSSFMGVSVFYAARGLDADERIKRMVEASRERRTLKVVTSDRALGDYVRRCGVEVIRSGEFRRRLDTAVAGRAESGDERRAGMEGSEMDEWMYYFGVSAEDDEAPKEEKAIESRSAPRVKRGGRKRRKKR